MKKLLLTSTLIACTLSAFSAFAADEKASCKINGAEYTISGTAANENVNFIIMPADKGAEDLTVDALNESAYIPFYAEQSGAYTKTFTLPDNFKSGKYKTVIYDGDTTEEAYFIYYNSSLDSLSGTLEGKTSEEKLVLVNNNLDNLGLSAEEAEGFVSALENLGTLKDNYADAQIVLMVKNGKLSDAITKYGSIYELDAKKYTDMKESAKTLLNNTLSMQTITDFPAQYKTARENALYATLENTTELKSLLEELNADFSDFNSLSENGQNTVLTKALNNKPQTASEMKALFEEYAAAQKNAPVVTPRPAVGGGGGGGGGNRGNSGFAAGTVLPDADALGGGAVGDIVSNPTETVLPDTASHWARSYIMTLNSKGIISGYDDGNFYPDKTITRAEFSKMIAQATDTALSEIKAAEFTDVSSGAWFAPYVYALADKGIITGYEDKTFLPDKLITREDSAVIIYRTMLDASVNMDAEAEFSDSNAVSDYAKESVKKLCGAGIINGSDGKFNPKSNLTRAEAAAIISRLLEKI